MHNVYKINMLYVFLFLDVQECINPTLRVVPSRIRIQLEKIPSIFIKNLEKTLRKKCNLFTFIAF